MRALMSTNSTKTTTTTTTTTISSKSRVFAGHKSQPPHRAQSTIGVPPRQRKNNDLVSSRFGATRPPPPSQPPPSQKREVTKQRNTNGRQTAPPIAPRLKPREPPVLAKQPPTAAAAVRKRADQHVLVRGGPAKAKAPSSSSLASSTSVSAGGKKATLMTTSTVFGRQNGTEKERKETIATSEHELEKQLRKKIEETTASPRRKRTLCKEALDDLVRKSNLFRGRLELIRDVMCDDDNIDSNSEDENEDEKKILKCLVCAENTEKIRSLEDSLRIEKLERSNGKRENAKAMKTIAELRDDVTQLGKIISRVFCGEIKPSELKEIAARFREATAAPSSSEDKNRSEDEEDEEEDEDEENQWTPLPKTSQFYGLPVEEISWGRTLTPRVMSPGYPVPKLDLSLVKNSLEDDDDDGYYRGIASNSSAISDDSFYDDQEEEEEEDSEDEDAEVDRWLNS